MKNIRKNRPEMKGLAIMTEENDDTLSTKWTFFFSSSVGLFKLNKHLSSYSIWMKPLICSIGFCGYHFCFCFWISSSIFKYSLQMFEYLRKNSRRNSAGISNHFFQQKHILLITRCKWVILLKIKHWNNLAWFGNH